jgi:hypothetical protein
VAFATALTAALLRPVWHDELYTLALARLPIADLFSALIVDSGPPLHYLLCHALYLLVGWPEGSALGTFLVRVPSVLAFAAMPWVVWSALPAAKRAGLWGPLLVVAWLPLLYFGTEARAYAVLALVNALVWIRGPAWIERGGGWIFAFAGCAGCLPLLHYTGLVSFLALPALALFIPPKRARSLAIALAGGAVGWLAWLPVMLGAPRASMDWLATTGGAGRPGISTVEVLAPAGPFPALFEAARAPVPWWLSVAVLVVLAGVTGVGAVRLMKGRIEDPPGVASAVRLAIGLLPAGALGMAALFGLPLYFAGRTESMVWALAAAVIAILTETLSPTVRRVTVGAYILVGVATISMWIADLPGREPSTGVMIGRELATRVKDGDRIVTAGLWQLQVRHGLATAITGDGSSTRPAPEVETIPRAQATHPGWLDHKAVTAAALIEEARQLREDAERNLQRIWLVWSPGLPLEETFFPAFEGWQRGRIAGSPVIAVDLLVPPADPTETPAQPEVAGR